MRPAELLAYALVAATCAACGGGFPQVARFSTEHRLALSPEQVCEQLRRASTANGQDVIVAQPARFAVRARYADRFGGHVFAVECRPDRTVTIRPHGPRVEPVGGADILPPRLEEELATFTDNVRGELLRLGRGGPTWTQAPPPAPMAEPQGARAGIHPDQGIVAAGAISLAVSYLAGSFASLGLAIDCEGPYHLDCEVGVATLAFLPMAHWAAGTSNNSGTATEAIVTGLVFSAIELASIIVMFAGAGHHRAGPVALSGPGSLTISF